MLRGLVEDPLANMWLCSPPRRLPTPYRPAQRGLWEAPKDRGQCGGHRGWDRHTHAHTQSWKNHKGRIFS